MNSNWKRNKLAAVYVNDEPTLTDQASASDTDINVIVKQYTVHGQVPGIRSEPVYEDWTEMPTDLRGFLELGDFIRNRRAQLPDALRNKTDEELLALTPDELRTILTPAPTPAPETKEPSA